MMNFESEDNDKPIYSIGSAARLLNISVHTLRMYEKEGLIIPQRITGKNRLYSEFDIERIRCIRNEINNKKYSIRAIQTILSLYPCWKDINCSRENRQSCPAYLNGDKPCWTYKHSENACADKDCRNCQVYRNIHCGKIKSKIIECTDN